MERGDGEKEKHGSPTSMGAVNGGATVLGGRVPLREAHVGDF